MMGAPKMAALKSIAIRGYKSIEDQALELSELNVVIGANGSGKSNLIGLFRFLEQVVTRNLQPHVGDEGGADRFLFHGRKRTKEIQLEFRFGENGYDLTLAPAVGDTLTIRREAAHFYGFERTDDYEVGLARGARESQLELEARDPQARIARYVYQAVSRWRVHHFHDTSNSAAVKKTADLDDNRVLRPDAENLAPFLLQLRDAIPDSYRQIVQHIRLVAPFFDDFVLEPSKRSSRKIKLEWRQKGSRAYFDAFSLSDGTLRFICLATVLLQPDPPPLILIDEPELGLHPFAIRVLADLIKAAATNGQLLIATQSVTLLNQLSVQDIIVAEHDTVRTTFSRPNSKALKAWLKNYAVGELWEKNLLGGRPRR